MEKRVKRGDYEGFLAKYRGIDFNGEWPTLVEMFNLSAKVYPNNKCFECFNPTHLLFTFAEAKKKIEEVSYYLMSLGLGKGDKIAVSGKNSPEWAIAYFGVLFAGATIVPLDITYNDKDLTTLLKFGDVKYLFIDGDKNSPCDRIKTF